MPASTPMQSAPTPNFGGMALFEYDVVFSSRRRTLGLTVERDRRLVVHAPTGTTPEQINQVLAQKKHWLRAKLAHPQKYPEAATVSTYVAGSSILYLGRRHKLQVSDTVAPGLHFDARHFQLSTADLPRAGGLVMRWLQERARVFITPRVARFAASLGVQYEQILISDLRYRWGSCTPNANLNFNWRLIQAPISVLDYVIVHELAHLLEFNHSPQFWNIVAVQLPHYQKAKDWLKEHGNSLE